MAATGAVYGGGGGGGGDNSDKLSGKGLDWRPVQGSTLFRLFVLTKIASLFSKKKFKV